MAAIDSTVVGIAFRHHWPGFHTSFGALQWVVTGYTLTLAALLLLGGSLGDHYGRRGSSASGRCGSSSHLPLARSRRAWRSSWSCGYSKVSVPPFLTPGSLAILQASFDPDDRGRAIGAWSGLGGVATAAGPLLGGYLVMAASWRWVFIINVPLGAFVLLLSIRHVPES